jgi:hypothetical protein
MITAGATPCAANLRDSARIESKTGALAHALAPHAARSAADTVIVFPKCLTNET